MHVVGVVCCLEFWLNLSLVWYLVFVLLLSNLDFWVSLLLSLLPTIPSKVVFSSFSTTLYSFDSGTTSTTLIIETGEVFEFYLLCFFVKLIVYKLSCIVPVRYFIITGWSGMTQVSYTLPFFCDNINFSASKSSCCCDIFWNYIILC